MSRTHVELCNCDPGCGCDFEGGPSSPEGSCEALVAHAIDGVGPSGYASS